MRVEHSELTSVTGARTPTTRRRLTDSQPLPSQTLQRSHENQILLCIRVTVSQVEELELKQTSNVGHYDVYTLLLLLLRPYTSKVIVQILVTNKEGKKRNVCYHSIHIGLM